MQEDFFIPMSSFNGWECKICENYVDGKLNKNTGIIEPTSKYWNVKRKEVFCGAAHALQRHEEIANER